LLGQFRQNTKKRKIAFAPPKFVYFHHTPALFFVKGEKKNINKKKAASWIYEDF